LIKGIDAENATLNKDLVLVHDDQSAQSSRSELVQENGVGRAVAFKDLALDQSGVGCLSSQILLDLLLGFAKCKGFRLCKEVAEQDLVMPSIRNRVVRFDGRNKISRYQLCSLMQAPAAGVLERFYIELKHTDRKNLKADLSPKFQRKKLDSRWQLVEAPPQIMGYYLGSAKSEEVQGTHSSLVGQSATIFRDGFAIRLHVLLLHVCE
jgi:hypothetical protein